MKIQEIIDRFNQTELTIDNFVNTIEFRHLDGSYCLFENAACIHYDGKWVGIFTEHLGKMLINRDDLILLNITEVRK